MLKLNGRKGQTFSIASSQGSPCEFTPRCAFTGERAHKRVLLVEVNNDGEETGRTRTVSLSMTALFALVAAPCRCWGRLWELSRRPAITIMPSGKALVAFSGGELEVLAPEEVPTVPV